MSSKISALTAGGAGISTDRIPVARSPFGSGDNAYLLFSAFGSLSNVSGADANTTLVTNSRYDVDMTAWATADRVYTLPTTSSVGDEIEVYVQLGNASFELILKTGAGQTCSFAGSTIGAATEITRLFISGEGMRFRYQATNIWECVLDARIPQACQMTRDAAQSISTATVTKIAFDNTVFTTTGMADVATNDRADIRRAGKYFATGSWYFAGLGNIHTQSRIHVNGAEVKTELLLTNGALPVTIPIVSEVLNLVAGDYVEFDVYHENGSSVNTDFSAEGTKPRLSVLEQI